jgi:hypothetical protein
MPAKPWRPEVRDFARIRERGLVVFWLCFGGPQSLGHRACLRPLEAPHGSFRAHHRRFRLRSANYPVRVFVINDNPGVVHLISLSDVIEQAAALHAKRRTGRTFTPIKLKHPLAISHIELVCRLAMFHVDLANVFPNVLFHNLGSTPADYQGAKHNKNDPAHLTPASRIFTASQIHPATYPLLQFLTTSSSRDRPD